MSTSEDKKKEFLAKYPAYGYGGQIYELREKEFAHLGSETYLDFTGSGLYQLSQVSDAHEDLKQLRANTHSSSKPSRRTTAMVEETRKEVLRFFNASESEYTCIFTSGATSGLKIVGECFPWSPSRSRYVFTQTNHSSVLGIRRYATHHSCTWAALTHQEVEALFNRPAPAPAPAPASAPATAAACDGDFYSLFAFPAESNFDGTMMPLEWISRAGSGFLSDRWPGGKWLVLLDAAAFVATTPLDLSKVKPHFVALSFYKMFGFPTGSGALLIRNDIGDVMLNPYFGGGTVTSILLDPVACTSAAVPKLHERYEYGTPNFLAICSLRHGFRRLQALGMAHIRDHTFALSQHLSARLVALRHSNGQPMAVVYGMHVLANPEKQGPVVAFNALDPAGVYIGYATVSRSCAANNFSIRSGSLCNPGAAQELFHIQAGQIRELTETGKLCGDGRDELHGTPIGVVRASLGYASTFEDVERFVTFIESFFKDKLKDTISVPVVVI